MPATRYQLSKHMLNKLFGSKARIKILKIFLLHPGEEFYIRQLSRNLKLQLNSVRRELENLEKFGLLISSKGETKKQKNLPSRCRATGRAGKKTGNLTSSKQEKKYYQADVEFVLFEEIKALIIKAQILYERDFVEKLMKIGKPKLLVFTGFFVNNIYSPVDLLLVGRFNKKMLTKLIQELESELSKEVNYTILSIKEFKYRRDITDVFLYNILEGKKLVVIDEMGVS